MPALGGKPAGDQNKPNEVQTTAPTNVDVDSAAWHTLLAEGGGWTADEIKAYVDAARVQWGIRRRKRS